MAQNVAALGAQCDLVAVVGDDSGGASLREHLHDARIRERSVTFLTRARLGYVVINHARAPKPLIDFVTNAWQLEELERNERIEQLLSELKAKRLEA